MKASGDLDVGRLFRVHQIYRSVVHDMSSVIEGSEALHKLLNEPPIYNLWQRMLIAALSCWVISMLGFDGSFVDSVCCAFLAARSGLISSTSVRRWSFWRLPYLHAAAGDKEPAVLEHL